jgi:hypothetical protein
VHYERWYLCVTTTEGHPYLPCGDAEEVVLSACKHDWLSISSVISALLCAHSLRNGFDDLPYHASLCASRFSLYIRGTIGKYSLFN